MGNIEIHLVQVHVHVTLHVVVPANIVPFGVAQVCLFNVEQQVEDLLLLVEEVHVGGATSGERHGLRGAEGAERQ